MTTAILAVTPVTSVEAVISVTPVTSVEAVISVISSSLPPSPPPRRSSPSPVTSVDAVTSVEAVTSAADRGLVACFGPVVGAAILAAGPRLARRYVTHII